MNSPSTRPNTNDYSSHESSNIFAISKEKKTKRLLRHIEIPPFNIDTDVHRVQTNLPKIKYSFFEQFASNEHKYKYNIKSSLF